MPKPIDYLKEQKSFQQKRTTHDHSQDIEVFLDGFKNFVSYHKAKLRNQFHRSFHLLSYIEYR